MFCFIGVYSLNNNFYELLIMIFFGFIGYIFRKLEYEPGPFLLAMILGPMMETSFCQSMGISLGDPMIFFKRPISAVLLSFAPGFPGYPQSGSEAGGDREIVNRCPKLTHPPKPIPVFMLRFLHYQARDSRSALNAPWRGISFTCQIKRHRGGKGEEPTCRMGQAMIRNR
jgi:hypothetical protein